METWLTTLSVVIAVVFVVAFYTMWRSFRRGTTPVASEDASSSTNSNSRPWRKNVLTLMLLAYSSLLGIFLIMILAGAKPKEAYDLIGVPFVALVGGTLAVAKDLTDN